MHVSPRHTLVTARRLPVLRSAARTAASTTSVSFASGETVSECKEMCSSSDMSREVIDCARGEMYFIMLQT